MHDTAEYSGRPDPEVHHSEQGHSVRDTDTPESGERANADNPRGLLDQMRTELLGRTDLIAGEVSPAVWDVAHTAIEKRGDGLDLATELVRTYTTGAELADRVGDPLAQDEFKGERAYVVRFLLEQQMIERKKSQETGQPAQTSQSISTEGQDGTGVTRLPGQADSGGQYL